MNISRKMNVVVTLCVLLVFLPALWGYYYYSKHTLLDSKLGDLKVEIRSTLDHYQTLIQLAEPRFNVLGKNLSLDAVFPLLSTGRKYDGEQHFVLDNNRRFLLAGAWQKKLDKDPDNIKIDPAERALNKVLTYEIKSGVEVLAPIMFNGAEYQVVASFIQPMGWTYFRLIPSEQILKPLYNEMVKTFFSFFLIAILLGIIIRATVRKIMIQPLLMLTNQARSYAAGKQPVVMKITGHDEVAELSHAFQTMHNELTKDAQQLLYSERRYRQVITSINEAIIQIDNTRCWHFLSPVWTKLSGLDLQQSLHKPVSDFLHPVDREYINFMLDIMLEGKQKEWNGDVRLTRSNGHYLWVNLSLHISHSDGMADKVITGTIEDIHINHIALAVNQLIRTAEQMVMTSHCSVVTILEFLTTDLIKLLDLPLAWVKVCEDYQGQILSHAGELSDFLFDNNQTWAGLHSMDGPVIKAVRDHVVVRVTDEDSLATEWLQRLNNDEIKDSLFIPFYLAGGETHAVIGLHSQDSNRFDKEFQKMMTDFSDSLRLICQMAEDQSLMRLHRAAVEKTANAIMITDKYGTIEWVNNAFTRQTQFQPIEVIGRKPTVLNSGLDESEQSIKDMWITIKSGKAWNGEVVNRRKDGGLISVNQTITPLTDDLGETTHYISVSEDVTERKESQQKIAFMATHDELTGLPNRSLLHDRLQQAISHAKRQQTKMAVLFIDIDHFKFINDSLGHRVGDELLKVLASRLISVLRQEDTVARFGGDEFVIVLPEVMELSNIKELANNLLEQIKKPYEIMSHELLITGSLGISIYPNDAIEVDDLIQHADSAMYLAKEQGRNNSQFYTAEINEKITRRLNLEKALRRAVDLDQFILYYQPKVDLKTGKITGVEALIRWQHPELGLVPPDEFIPLAEETGIIIDIGDWVMLTACMQMKSWQQDYPDLENMSINVSARQFWQDDFMMKVEKVLSTSQVKKGSIELELTESVVMNDVASAISTMDQLKKLGVMLSLDDFGTGYSSLSYLQRFPVDVLKIDRSFISILVNSHSDSAIINSILSLADNFGLRVVAEGIEEAHQEKILREMGCHYGQGYYFSRPISSDEMALKLMEQI